MYNLPQESDNSWDFDETTDEHFQIIFLGVNC